MSQLGADVARDLFFKAVTWSAWSPAVINARPGAKKRTQRPESRSTYHPRQLGELPETQHFVTMVDVGHLPTAASVGVDCAGFSARVAVVLRRSVHRPAAGAAITSMRGGCLRLVWLEAYAAPPKPYCRSSAWRLGRAAVVVADGMGAAAARGSTQRAIAPMAARPGPAGHPRGPGEAPHNPGSVLSKLPSSHEPCRLVAGDASEEPTVAS